MLSVVIITKNEQTMLGGCLESVEFADEVVVVDTGNTDLTNVIAKKFGARIVTSHGTTYSKFRNDGLKAAQGDWILFVDADERITPKLKNEIIEIVKTKHKGVYEIPRLNNYLGRFMHFGGWGNDKVIRLFQRTCLIGYRGDLHEQPEFNCELSTLSHQMVHFSHRDLSTMVDKTLLYTGYESQLRLKSKHPPIVWWRFIRVMATEFWIRFIKFQAARDGVEGVIDGLFQVFNTFIIYARVWEAQI